MNRKESLQKTLPFNLNLISKFSASVELNLVNFIKDSESHEIHDWILSLDGQANFNYYVCTKLDYWHCSIAKNTSHLSASGRFVINLDCDNFISENSINSLLTLSNDQLENSIYLGYSGQIKKIYRPWLRKNFRKKYKFVSNKDSHDGTAGLIGCPMKLFTELGGYDESLPPMGGQDKNFFNRAIAYNPDLMIAHIPSTKNAIKNSKAEGLLHSKTPHANWKKFDKLTYKKTKIALRKNQLKANMTKKIGLEIINGYKYIDE